MAETYTLNVYQDGKQVGTGDSAKVHVDLEPKEYPAGTFKGELVDSAGTKSAQFGFPAVTVAAPETEPTTPAFDPAGDTKPTDSNTIDEITAWLDAHSIDHTGKTLKADLLALVPTA
ncbi:hypothetical protein [Secundilactobacillus muriivasis]